MKLRLMIMNLLLLILSFKLDTGQTYFLEDAVELQIPGASSARWNHNGTKLGVEVWPDIQIWDTSTWTLSLTIQDAFVYSIQWHPFEDILAGTRGGREESLLLWDATTGKLLHQVIKPLPNNFRGIAILHDLSWSPDGNAIASDSVLDTVLIWHPFEGDIVYPLVSSLPTKALYHNIIELDWSPDGEMLLSGGTDGTIRIWDALTGEPIWTVNGYRHVSWNHDNVRFAGAVNNRYGGDFVSIWNLHSERVERVFTEHTGAIISVEWIPDGSIIASVDGNGILKVWDAITGSSINIKNKAEHVRSADWRPDGQQLSTAINFEKVIIWNLVIP